MSVFTTVTQEDLLPFLQNYPVGTLRAFKGIAAGVTNTNYWVSTTTGDYVLTLFETLNASALPFYVHLMLHLAHAGLPVARPIPKIAGDTSVLRPTQRALSRRGVYIDALCHKPTLLVEALPGTVTLHPTSTQCWQLGKQQARLHTTCVYYHAHMPNPRGLAWIRRTVAQVEAFLPRRDAALLRDELSRQEQYPWASLPGGIVHADLFRDNVLMQGERVTGIIDFYYACNASFLYDVAIAVNDWCVTQEGALDEERVLAFLAGYQSVRAFAQKEKQAWPMQLRAATLRFWTARLLDFYKPMEGELIQQKDPKEFQAILQWHRQRNDFWL